MDALSEVRENNEDLVLEINTLGGDADTARRMALEVRLFIRHSGRSAFCVGKTCVYSAGVTVLAAFLRENRYLTDDAVLLIHERQLETAVELEGPAEACVQIVKEKLSMLLTAQRLEREGFEELVVGSDLTVEALIECIRENCYMSARQALEHGLIGKIVA